MSEIILCNISDATVTIEEFRQEWIIEVLLNLGVPQNLIEKDISELRFELSETYGIEVELISNKNINVYKKQWNNDPREEMQNWLPSKKENLVAQWKEPIRIKKVEGNEVFYEIHLEKWSFVG